jgi:acyl-CoA reductase-like NAD-dependent aldehyde dehydrogenase
LTLDSTKQKYAQTVVSTRIVPGCVQFLGEEKRFYTVWVNCYQAMDPAVPFGGYKMSGYGRESGKQHVEEYLNVKAVWIKTG